MSLIPTYSQLRPDPKADLPIHPFPRKEGKKYDDFGEHRFGDLFTGTWRNRVADALTMPPGHASRSVMMEEEYQGDDMPCYKPPGQFSMEVYSPAEAQYKMPIKKFVVPQRSFRAE